MNYTRIYNDIIQRAQFRQQPLVEYTEQHHIIPRSLGGSDDVLNIVALTAREHFIAHWLLYKMHRNENKHKMAKAWNMMCSGSTTHTRYTSYNFKYAREASSQSMLGELNPAKKYSVRQKISKALTGTKKSKQTRRKISKATTAEKCTFFKGYPVIDGILYSSIQEVIDNGLATNKSQVDYRMRSVNWTTWYRSDKIKEK